MRTSLIASITTMMMMSPALQAQERMTPELLWRLHRVQAEAISPDGKTLFYASTTYHLPTENKKTRHYALDIQTGKRQDSPWPEGKTVVERRSGLWVAHDKDQVYVSEDKGKTWSVKWKGLEGGKHIKLSPDGNKLLFVRKVPVDTILGKEKYPQWGKTTAHIYEDLHYRHWDTWADGKAQHLFLADLTTGKVIDLLEGEPYEVPQKPFGGPEDFIWTPDSKGVIYVCKKKKGKAYAQSTNTDLYHYQMATGETENLTEENKGYDTHPKFSKDGRYLLWTAMKRDGYEADKNDLYVMDWQHRDRGRRNLTAHWDGTVDDFYMMPGSQELYFVAPWRGTRQVFTLSVPRNIMDRKLPAIRQATEGNFDIHGIVGSSHRGELVVARMDMNHASEIFALNLKGGALRPLTQENAEIYNRISTSRTELRMTETFDGRQMGVWVIYPPDFDSTKKYPTLLYCQGGPQSALSQFYSFRWNFQLMAAQGYIVVAPNRRGMPGWGTEWNELISKDWAGGAMKDYLAAIDMMAKEPYVDTDRLGCVGASYGGYSVFTLAGMHEGRFKSFIAHDGLYDLRSWYGTTEELFFANWDLGGAYWDQPQPESYQKADPSLRVDKWDTPIMIIQGGLDFRVGIEQGLEAFQAAQLRGIPSKLLYFPNENHWILNPHNALVWQTEFFSWLEETLGQP